MMQHSSFAADDYGHGGNTTLSSFEVGEHEVIPPPRGPRRWLKIFRSFLLFCIAIGICAAIVFIAYSAMTGNSNYTEGKRIVVVIPPSSNGDDISQILFDEGVIRNKSIFAMRLRLSGKAPTLKSGTFKLTAGADFEQIISVIQKGPAAAPTFNVTFPEGYRLTEMQQSIDKQHQLSAADGLPLPRFTGRAYAAAVKQQRVPAKYRPPAGTITVEGFLFPATYELRHTDGAARLVAKQMQAFSDNFDAIDLSYAKSRNLTPYEVVIIASMIEREARTDDERAKISSVIYNRLKIGMTLGIDATIQYAVDDQKWVTDLRESHLAIDSPYNTRLRAGLPPTPIASPGLASLKAAAKPDTTKYLYYVALPDGSGKHYFTDSYDDFLNNQ